MDLTRRGLLGLAAGAGLVLAGCSTSSPTGSPSASTSASGSSTKVTIGLTYIPNIQFVPFYWADAKGLFAASGVNAKLRHHGSSEALFTALASGQEDFVVAGADEMLQARSQGMDLVAIAQYYRQYPVVGIVKDASAIKTAADLKGKSVGVPGKYGESWFALLVLLKSAGLTEADVKVSEIGYTQQAALSTDKVDAIMGFSNNDVVTFQAAGIAVRTLPLTTGTLPLISVSLITTRKFLDANPAVAKEVADACTAGFVAVAKDQPAAVTLATDYVTTLKTDAAARTGAATTLAATVPLWKDASGAVNPTLDAAQFASMATFMREQGIIAASVDPALAMSNTYHS
jgi:NitT/TauT family transport system substrate-binding protein